MKITLLGTAFPFRGGMANFNERLAKAFIEEGNEVLIENFSLQYPNFLFPGKTQYSEGAAPESLNIVSSMNSVNPLSWLKVGQRIKKDRPDVVIVAYWIPFMAPCLGTISRIARSNGHTKVISILHNMIPHEHRIGDKQFSSYFARSVDGFISLSKSVLEDIQMFDQEKPRVFSPHPVYDTFGEHQEKKESIKQLNLSKDFRYILFFGLIRDYKGLDLLLEAFNNKTLRESNIKLIVAGEYYADAEVYESIIRNNQLEDKVIVHARYIPDGEVASYFAAADLIVQPYKTATQSGITQVAYHFNKPMVVTNVGGLPEICPHEKVGYVVERNSDEIAKAILRFYDEDAESGMIENIKEEKKKYSWSYFTNNMYHLFEKLK